MLLTDIENPADTYADKIIMALPGDDDDIEDDSDTDDGWEEIEDEDFDDLLNDRDDLNEISIEDNELGPEDDDHLPDDDF